MSESPNAEQVRYWNEEAGPKWVRLQDRLDALVGGAGRLALDSARPSRGESVLDIGCGCGQTSLELARRVGESGRVFAVDISAPMLEVARRRALAVGLNQLRFVNADAQLHKFAGGGFDLVFSRFGVMFFQDPVAAFANLKSALRSGGRLSFVCWRALAENEWMRIPLGVVGRHVELPEPAAPGTPGPLAFADPNYVRDVLTGAGFRAVQLEGHDIELELGTGVTAAVEFLMEMGPAGAAIRAAGVDDPSAIADELETALQPFAKHSGVSMAGAIWVVAVEV